MPLSFQQGLLQGAAEPMQVDGQVEENDNVEEDQFVVENSSIDLEQYASQYSGLAKLNRLLFISDHCPPLKVEALRMALSYVLTTYNTNLYQQVHRKLQEAVSSSSSLPDAVAGIVHNVPGLDTQWIEITSKKAALKLEKLDTDLKNYKSNSIKESIRRGHDDLGDHYLDCGDLSNALKCYSRARDYCTSPKHVVNMCLNVIKVSVYLQNWSHVQSYVNKAESTPEMTEHAHAKDGGQSVLTKLKSFKLFLELEPQLRDIIHKFYESSYAQCLRLLTEIKDTLLLDMYLASHVNTLYTQIRNRALCQYFSPYLSADMRKMAEAFNTTITDLEDELMQLILDGQINARIDSHNKILYAKDTDQRSSTFEKSLAMGKEYQRRTKALILRSAILKNQVHVKSPPRDGGQGGEMSIAPGSASSARN
ncbi:COPS1 [Mytilus edulis]|uniref:GPS1 n=1 Tax=Mytilus edulis TaxID=6550 RepID=A0A8S3UJ02_MYTED|nr:COPS1 [Mytilus edulis]